MSDNVSGIGYIDEQRSDAGLNRMPPPPGRQAIVVAALALGGLVLTLQLWLLTVALELYLEGRDGSIWIVALFSGLDFAGGLVVWRVLSRRPRLGNG